VLISLLSTRIVGPIEAAEYPFHQKTDELVVTRGGEVIRTLPCERIPLDGKGRWGVGPSGYHYIRGIPGQTSDGNIYAQVGGAYGGYWVVKTCQNVMFASEDQGRTWTSWNVDLPKQRIIGAFTVLRDDSFLAATTEPTDDRVCYYRSIDRGRTWKLLSELSAAPFNIMYLDGNLLELRDGTILSVLHFKVEGPADGGLSQDLSMQYLVRSTDGGKTWQGGPDPKVWKAIIDAKLMVSPTGPDSRVPGGTFPGCYETGLAQDRSGRVVAALRFSGPPWYWHKKFTKAWGGKAPDSHGRIFKQVMFSSSPDGGQTWDSMRPFADANGKSVIVQLESNGQLVPLPDGRLVLVHQRRFGEWQLIARVSNDNGATWSHDEYRLSAGFGFSGNTVLDDGTILTVTGNSVNGKAGAQVIRWRLPKLSTNAADTSAKDTSDQNLVSVSAILKSRFERVQGPSAGESVLDTGNAESWNSDYVVMPTVHFDGEQYRMWFVGGASTKDSGVPYGFYERIGLATSKDGVHWDMANDGNPVLDLGPTGSVDSKGVTHPYVLKVGEKYMMWYGAIDGSRASHLGLSPGNVRIERICLATSTDGIHWQRENAGKPVLDIGLAGTVDSIQATGMHVIKTDDQFVMWYGAYDGVHTIAIATSPDGIHWTKGNEGSPVFGLQGSQQCGPSVYFDGEQYLMIYSCLVQEDGTYWKNFAATSQDGIQWQPAFEGGPLLGPAPKGNFGNADGVGTANHTAHPTKMIFQNDRVQVWYFAESSTDERSPRYPAQRIGLMEATIPTDTRPVE